MLTHDVALCKRNLVALHIVLSPGGPHERQVALNTEWTNSAAAAAAASAEADLHPFVTHTGLTVKTVLFLFLIVTHSSSMKGLRLNFHAERQLAGHPKTTFFFCKVEFQPFKRLYSQLTFFNFLYILQSVTPTGIHPSYS